MQEPALPQNEASRLSDLLSLQILDTDPDPDFDDIVNLTSNQFKMPTVLVSLVDKERQWFKAKVGIHECELPRSISFCGHAILGSEIFVVADADKDPRFNDNPLVTTKPCIKFYAGAPLINSNGHALGTLCLIDSKPRTLDATELDQIRKLARQVMILLELRKAVLQKIEDLKVIKTLSDQVLDQAGRLTYLEKLHVLSEMASGVCHEVNNPLAIITLALSSIRRTLSQDSIDPTSLYTNLDRAEKSAFRIGKIVNSLRTFSRSEAQDAKEMIDFTDVSESSLVLCEERIRAAGIQLSLAIDKGIYLEARLPQLIQVVYNLLLNAKDAAEKETERWIRISAGKTPDSGHLLFRITDSGRGIDPSIAGKIMLPFFTTKEIGEGTGLGLSICLGLISEHAGTIGYELDHGHTSFVIRLPLS